MRFALLFSFLVVKALCSPISYNEAVSSLQDNQSSIEKLEPTQIQSAVESSIEKLEPTQIQSAVESSIEKLEPTPIQSAVESSIEKLEPTQIQSAVESSIEKLEPTQIQSAVESSIEKLEQTTIQSAVESSIEKLEPTPIQSAVESSIEKLEQTTIQSSVESSIEKLETTTLKAVDSSVEKLEATTSQSVDDNSLEIRQQNEELPNDTKKDPESSKEQNEEGNQPIVNQIIDLFTEIENSNIKSEQTSSKEVTTEQINVNVLPKSEIEDNDTPQEESAVSVESVTEQEIEKDIVGSLDVNEQAQTEEEVSKEKSQTTDEDDVLQLVSKLKDKYIDDQVSYIDNDDYSNDVSLDSFDFGLENEFDGMKATYGLDKLKKLKLTKKGLPLLAKVIGILVAAGTVDSTMIEALIEGVMQEVQNLADQIDTSGASAVIPDISSVVGPEDLNFRGDEKTAEAVMRGAINGEIFFIQNYDGEGNPDDMVIAGTLAGMRSDTYTVTVHEWGITESESCTDAGRAVQTGTKWEDFTPDSNGEALIFLLDNKLSLDGSASIMDRTVVVKSATTGHIAGCGSIKQHQL